MKLRQAVVADVNGLQCGNACNVNAREVVVCAVERVELRTCWQEQLGKIIIAAINAPERRVLGEVKPCQLVSAAIERGKTFQSAYIKLREPVVFDFHPQKLGLV